MKRKASTGTGDHEPALLHLLGLLRPYTRQLLLALVMLFALTGVNILVPQLIAMVFNQVFPHGDWVLLGLVIAGLLVLFIARNLLYFHGKFTVVRVGENVCFILRRRLFERLQQMSLQYYRKNRPGELSSRVMNDSTVIQQFIQNELPKVLQAAFLFLGLLAALYAMNWELALASTVVLPLHFLTYHLLKSPIKRASRNAQEHLGEATGNLVEKFLGIEVVKSFTAEERENAAFRRAIQLSRRSQLSGQRFIVLQKVAADLLVGLGMIFLIAFGAHQVIGGDLSAGAFIAFFMYVRMLYPTVLDLMNGFAKLSKTMASIERAFELLGPGAAVSEAGGGVGGAPAGDIAGEIAFDRVTFGFPGSAPVLDEVTFTVPAGEVCAIVGPSGAGKSTLASLVPRFNEPGGGTVRLDGRPLAEYDLRELRESVGMVFQDCFLFGATILENLRYADPEADEEQIHEIARRAGADAFIRGLPNGYDTPVGEGGVSLSRGEKQLVTLARAMLKDPRVLILDEATASIDAEKEAEILPSVLELMRGRTTLLITHKRNLLRHAQQVVRLERGRVVYNGPPDGLEWIDPAVPDPTPEPAPDTPPPEPPPPGPGPSLAGTPAPPAETWPDPGPGDAAAATATDGLRESRSFGRSAGPGALPLLLLAVSVLAIGAAPGRLAAQDAAPPAPEPAAAPAPVEVELTARDLASKRIRLSYIDPERCLQILTVFGFKVGKPGEAADPKAVPHILALPGAAPVTLPAKDAVLPNTQLDPLGELLVLFHPDKPEQFSDVLNLIKDQIDVPARQIMIEAMVLEVGEGGLEKLGVEWELNGVHSDLESLKLSRSVAFATAGAGDEEPTAEAIFPDVFGEFKVTLQALVREGTAKILSRPSVLTVDGRMAYISVARKIPVVNSITNPKGNITVSFREVTAGIELTVRPHVSENGDEIGLQVHASVTSEVPNEDIIVRDGEGLEVARSPTISVREVKTYTRIANNTPFIIGGLVAQDDIIDTDKVPILGDIPLIKRAFRSSRRLKVKREVIIVLTPFVLPEDLGVGRNLPKDEDAFDSFGNQLFRDAYRIRAEDVFDLRFITENRSLRRAQRRVDAICRGNHFLGASYPFSSFVDGHLPGEEILVYRQMYEVIKRKELDEQIDDGQIIFFRPDRASQSGFKVAFLEPYIGSIAELKKAAGVAGADSFDPLDALAGQAVALTYTSTRDSDSVGDVLREPVPEIRLLDCPDDATFEKLLWDLNQPDEQQRERYTVLLRERGDLTRLKRAIILKRTVAINASRQTLSLRNFTVGRLLLLPEFKAEKLSLIDLEVAKYFFYTEQYYQALQARLKHDSAELDKVLAEPRYAPFLRGVDGPPQGGGGGGGLQP